MKFNLKRLLPQLTSDQKMSAKKESKPPKNPNTPKVSTANTNKPKKGLRTLSNTSTANTSNSKPLTMTAVPNIPVPTTPASTSNANQTAVSPNITTAAPSPTVQQQNKDESTYEKIATPTQDAFSTSIYKKAIQTEKKKMSKSLYIPGQDIGPAGLVLASKGFKVLEKCGTGNYAKVYKVRSSDEKDFAVKIIDLSKTSKNYRVRFLPRELDILARLQHRNIVQIYEILQSAKMIFIFMEYTPNGTVADFLRQFRAIPEYVCKPMFTQIVDAINYMHAQLIAHRDLKLENILIDKYGHLKLTDFSYSLICSKDETGHLVLSRTFCGSLPYIPPEVLQEHEYDPRVADVWSLGVCLYVMLNDGLPFKFHEIATMLQSQLTKDWKFKAKVSGQLSETVKDLISRMLEPDVKARITSPEILAHQWIWKSK